VLGLQQIYPATFPEAEGKMPVQDASAASFRFSTDDLLEPARAKVVRELHEHTTLPNRARPEPLEPLRDYRVRLDITKRALPGAIIMSGTLCGVRHAVRSRGSVSSSEDDLLVAVNLSGCTIAQSRDRELVLLDGDAMLMTRDSISLNLIHPAPVNFLGFRVPRDAIAPLASSIDDALIRMVPAGSEAIKLLVTYARAIAEEQQSLDTPELQRLVATHIHDLIALAVGATRDGHAIAKGRGIRAARLRAIMSDITANLGDCDLTVAAVAQRQRVTPRYLHKLFEGEELTFSTFVLSQRLSRAHRMLRDSRFSDRSISSVAFDVGFGDLSYFNRTFRRRYDATPSDIRHSAGRNDSRPHAS
jgi:AraC-like DNA-binding protein